MRVIGKFGLWHECNAAVVAVAFVVVCACCVKPLPFVLRPAERDDPWVSLSADDFPIELGPSAGFFMPTAANVSSGVILPTLKYDIGSVDVHTVSVLKDVNRHQITSELHAMDEVLPDSILDSVEISTVGRLSAIELDISDGTTQLEDILSGNRISCDGRHNLAAGALTLLCKIGSIWFASPAELCQFPMGNNDFAAITRAALKPLDFGGAGAVPNFGTPVDIGDGTGE
jgi:hypothetical protein